MRWWRLRTLVDLYLGRLQEQFKHPSSDEVHAYYLEPVSYTHLVTVLAVSIDADENNYRRFLRDHHVTLLSVRDPDQKSSSLYGTSKFPETYIIDRNGVVRRKFIGAVDWTEPEVIDFLSKL